MSKPPIFPKILEFSCGALSCLLKNKFFPLFLTKKLLWARFVCLCTCLILGHHAWFFLFFLCGALSCLLKNHVFLLLLRFFFRSKFLDEILCQNNGFACFFRGSCAALRSQPDVGNSRFSTILQRCWSWRCSNSCTFWSSSWREFWRRQISACYMLF